MIVQYHTWLERTIQLCVNTWKTSDFQYGRVNGENEIKKWLKIIWKICRFYKVVRK